MDINWQELFLGDRDIILEIDPTDSIRLSLYRNLPVTTELSTEFVETDLPPGLTISEDGHLLNWQGENYYRDNRSDMILLDEWVTVGDDGVGVATLPAAVFSHLKTAIELQLLDELINKPSVLEIQDWASKAIRWLEDERAERE